MLATRTLSLVLWGLLVGLAPAQVKLQLVSGEVLEAQLRSLSDAEGLRVDLASGESRQIPRSDLVSLFFPQPGVLGAAANSGKLRFDIVGGDHVFGEVLDGDFDQVRIESDAGRIDLPLDHLRGLRVLANAEGLRPELLASAAQDRDLVFIRSGSGIDQVVGEVARFARNGVFFDWTGDEASLFAYRKDRVVAVRLAATLAPEAPEGNRARVHFRDGSVLSGQVRKAAGGALTLEHPVGFKLDLDANRVAAISFYGANFSHLSDLEPSAFIETPYIEGGLGYGFKRDESLKGGALSVSETWFPKGLSLHSKSVLSYALNGRARSFSTALGLDGRVADERVKGSIAFSIRVDGKVVYGPKVRRAGDPPLLVSDLSLEGAQELSLVADFADNHHFHGWAVWGMPVVSWQAESR